MSADRRVFSISFLFVSQWGKNAIIIIKFVIHVKVNWFYYQNQNHPTISVGSDVMNGVNNSVRKQSITIVR